MAIRTGLSCCPAGQVDFFSLPCPDLSWKGKDRVSGQDRARDQDAKPTQRDPKEEEEEDDAKDAGEFPHCSSPPALAHIGIPRVRTGQDRAGGRDDTKRTGDEQCQRGEEDGKTKKSSDDDDDDEGRFGDGSGSGCGQVYR